MACDDSTTIPEVSRALLRALPAVHVVAERAAARALAERYGRAPATDALRAVIDGYRAALRAGDAVDPDALAPDAIVARAAGELARAAAPNLRSVINATGIVLHTGLGRAVLPRPAVDALGALTGCCNVQMDLDTGARVKREAAIRELVRQLTGSDDVLLVNNNAGATMLVLRALARDRDVIVSRGELIEIGGSFRLPDIMSESGAIMREVGTTNKTHLRDYERAIVPEQTALLFKAHKSNYKIIGFTQDVAISELAALGRRYGLPVVDDLGCGALLGLEAFGLEHEGTVRESLEAGADIVLFSTDKLIGGPQGGMIVGRPELLARIRAHPMYRALRVGKLTLTALEATLRTFAAPELLARTNPTYIMLARQPNDLREQAEQILAAVQPVCMEWQLTVADEPALLGGGSLPGTEIPSVALRISPKQGTAEALAAALRHANPPIIPHTRDDAVVLNMRTVMSEEVDRLTRALTDVYEIRNPS